MTKSVLIDAFIVGLETTLQVEVKSRHPVNLKDCTREAQMVNDRDLTIKLALNEWGCCGWWVSEAQAHDVKNVTLNTKRERENSTTITQ